MKQKNERSNYTIWNNGLLSSLPFELNLAVFQYLPNKGILNLRATSKENKAVVDSAIKKQNGIPEEDKHIIPDLHIMSDIEVQQRYYAVSAPIKVGEEQILLSEVYPRFVRNAISSDTIIEAYRHGVVRFFKTEEEAKQFNANHNTWTIQLEHGAPTEAVEQEGAITPVKIDTKNGKTTPIFTKHSQNGLTFFRCNTKNIDDQTSPLKLNVEQAKLDHAEKIKKEVCSIM